MTDRSRHDSVFQPFDDTGGDLLLDFGLAGHGWLLLMGTAMLFTTKLIASYRSRSPQNLHTGIQRGDNPGMNEAECPFCQLEKHRILLESDFAAAFLDGFPVADGHTLIVPKQHVGSLFDLPEVELTDVWKLVSQVRGKLLHELNADGFNIGVNDGLAAGQTVMHAHVHIIPRRKGDVSDPRGGMRWIMPEKARYWDEGQQ